MNESITITGDAEIVTPGVTGGNGNTPALTVDAENGHGILDIDIRGYAKIDHTHDEYAKKDEAVITGIHYDLLYEGIASTVGDYQLKKPITPYQFIMVCFAGIKSNNILVQRQSNIINKADIVYITDQVSEMCGVWDCSDMSINFTSASTFRVMYITVNKPAWSGLCVYKIYGIY